MTHTEPGNITMTRSRGQPPKGPNGEPRDKKVRVAASVRDALHALAALTGDSAATTLERLILDEHARRFPS